MEIVVRGQSGEGKSAIATLIADTLQGVGMPVVLVDDGDTRPREQHERALWAVTDRLRSDRGSIAIGTQALPVPEALDCIRMAILDVLTIIEQTYDHDEHGSRTDGDSSLSGADVVEMLVGLENRLVEAVDTIRSLRGDG